MCVKAENSMVTLIIPAVFDRLTEKFLQISQSGDAVRPASGNPSEVSTFKKLRMRPMSSLVRREFRCRVISSAVRPDWR